MGEPAGWYRDPAPANPGEHTTLRYWDGRGWTTQLRPASKQLRRQWQTEQLVAHQEYVAQQVAAGQPAYATDVVVVQRSRHYAPDGAPLAGWWARFFAALIDSVVTTVAGLAFGWVFIRMMAERGSQLAAGSAGGVPASDDDFVTAFLGPYLGLLAVMWLVRVLYFVFFLKGFSATPGKFVLGLEVRRRDRSGVLPWGTVLARVGVVEAPNLLAVVPVAGLLAWVFWLLDHLWPLWDGNRQALHDHVASTSVVRTR